MQARIAITAGLCLMLTACGDQGGDTKPRSVPLAEYTADVPGQWVDIKDTHDPKIEYRRADTQNNLIVYVTYKDKDPQHKVQVMGVVDENNKDVVTPVRFGEAQTYYQGTFTIASFRDAQTRKWKVYVKCLQHDLWTREIKDHD